MVYVGLAAYRLFVKQNSRFGRAKLKGSHLVLGLILTALVGPLSFSGEPKNTSPPAKPANPISELKNQDTVFSILMEAFQQIQGRIIQNDYEARIMAANALGDPETRRYVVALAKQESALRMAKLYHEMGELNLTYDHGSRVDSPTVLKHLDTVPAARTLMDYVFIAPTDPDKDGEIKTTTVPVKNFLLGRLPPPLE